MIYNKNILHLNKGGISSDTFILDGQCLMIDCYLQPWNLGIWKSRNPESGIRNLEPEMEPEPEAGPELKLRPN